MAITKETTHNAIIRGDYVVICKEKNIIKDGGVEVSSAKGVDRWINPDSDISKEPTKIKTICDIHFTSAIKTAWGKLSDSEKNDHKQG